MIHRCSMLYQNDGQLAEDQEILAPILDALYKKAPRPEEEHSPEKPEPEEPGEVYIWKQPDRRTAKEKEKAAFLDKLKHGQPKTWARPFVWLLRRLMGLNRLIWEMTICGAMGLLMGQFFYWSLVWMAGHV